MEPDTILLASSVVTMDPALPRAEAVSVGAGRITAVGNRAEILAMAGGKTEVIDVASKFILPGLIEPHTHPDLCAQCYAWTDVSGFSHSHVAGVEESLRQAVAAAAPGEWVFAFGLDAMLTKDLGTWGRDRLDAIAPDNPVAVMIQSMHTVFVNSAAFAAAGVDEKSPDPPGGPNARRWGRLVLTYC